MIAALQVTLSVVDLYWPEGIVMVRFDSSERGADEQAQRVARDVGGRVLAADEETVMTEGLAGSPWPGAGTICAVAMLPSRLAEFLSSMSATCEALVFGRSGFDSARPGGAGRCPAAVRRVDGRLVVRRGDGISAGDVADPVALDLMRSVKRQLDPALTLSPGRHVGGI